MTRRGPSGRIRPEPGAKPVEWDRIDPRLATVDITSSESIIANLVVPRILVDGKPGLSGSRFSIEDNEAIVYTDMQDRRFLIEVHVFEISDDDATLSEISSAKM